MKLYTLFDDGEPRGVAQSRDHAATVLENAISNLVRLRKDIEGIPYKDFCEKYG